MINLIYTIMNATQRNATQRNATQRNATQRNATQRNALAKIYLKLFFHALNYASFIILIYSKNIIIFFIKI